VSATLADSATQRIRLLMQTVTAYDGYVWPSKGQCAARLPNAHARKLECTCRQGPCWAQLHATELLCVRSSRLAQGYN
jgi:hypothetical protein